MSQAQGTYRIPGRPQTIYRVMKSAENPYVMIDRRPIDNPLLSFKAKGILTYLMSRPDGWEVSIPDLIAHAKDGEDGVRAGMKELKDAGHVKYTCSREQGRITGWLIEVFEVPHREKPDVALPDVVNPTQVLSTLSNTELSNTDLNHAPDGAKVEVPENYPMDWQIAGNVEHLIVPDEGEIFTSDARSFASLIAMNNADLEPLAFQFMLSANKLPADKDVKFWRKAFRGYADNKTRPATAKDIREAVKMHIGRNLSIKNPLSIEWAVTEIITPTPKAETKNEPKAFDGIRKFLLNHAEE